MAHIQTVGKHDMVSISRTCPMCGHLSKIAVYAVEYIDWQLGALAQQAFKSLSIEDREIVITGMCRDCQDAADFDESQAEIEHYRRHGYDV